MESKQILVIGAGIAGCAAALAISKRGIPVTMITSSYDQRIYHAPFIQHEKLAERVLELQHDRQNQASCSRAHEQLTLLARKSIDELLGSNYLVDRNGNVDIHRCLQEQLKRQENVEWLSHHVVIELLTLDQHSFKQADRYKKPACFGAVAYNYENQKLDYFLAKETILATGGAASLYPYSTHSMSACGEGLAIANQAGARLLNMDQVYFHPIGLYVRDHPCFPLPLELLARGGKILSTKGDVLDLPHHPSKDLLFRMYQELLKSQREHLWLDLTHVDHAAIKNEFPTMDAFCLNQGFNFVKDQLPIVPVASYHCGGVAVDRTGQSSLLRLRAIGDVACTGIFWNFKDEALGVLESLIWAYACAEDIAKQVDRFVYYFPEIKRHSSLKGISTPGVEEDWKILKNIMWLYVGIKQDSALLERGISLLGQLLSANLPKDFSSSSIEQLQLYHAIQTAQLMTHSACKQGLKNSLIQGPVFHTL